MSKERETGKEFFKSNMKFRTKSYLASVVANAQCNDQYEGEDDQISECINGVNESEKIANIELDQKKKK